MNEQPIEIAALVFAILLMIGMYSFFNYELGYNSGKSQQAVGYIFQTKSRDNPDSSGQYHPQPKGNNSTTETPTVKANSTQTDNQ